MRWVWRAESGAGKVEYAALVILAGVLIGALVVAGLPTDIKPAVTSATCTLFGGDDCDPVDAEGEGTTGGDGSGGSGDGDGSGDGGDGDEGSGQDGPDALQQTGGPPGTESGGEDEDSQGDAYTGPPNTEPVPAGFDGSAADDYFEALAELEEAEREGREAGDADVLDELLGLLSELIGIEDAKKCFLEGDIWACIMTALNALPWGKIFKAIGMVPDILRLFNRWRKRSKVDDAIDGARTKVDNAAGRCKPSSFTAGTPVLLADGTTVPIEDVRAGALVLATDPATGRTRARPVTAVRDRTAERVLVDVRVFTEGGSAAVTATGEHPFWANNVAWTDAADLRPGDTLLRPGGEAAVVAAVGTHAQRTTVYNFSVAELNTYYVGGGDHAVLVHNDADACELAPGGGLKAHENAGGHAMERHVGKDDQWLKDRTQDKIPNVPGTKHASTYTDRAIAEKATAKAMAKESATIDDWLKNPPADPAAAGQLKLDNVDVDLGPLGKTLTRQGSKNNPTGWTESIPENVTVYLKRDPASPDGFIIWTSFPSTP